MTNLPKIPGYQVLEKLGQGGMADVYLGIQEKLQRQVAIKVMIPSLFRDQQFSKRFIKEAQTAAQLTHPNIITIHDVGDTGDSHYIVMEYLEESLSDGLKQRRFLPPKQALEVVRMIASALDYAHKKGFIHRDIKPDNIMFRSDGTVVLVDFGIARAMDATTHLTRTGMSIGTPHYMSPEQCRGEKIDGRSDLYSLGVQLFEMLTGEVPYKAENTAGIIIKHIQEPVPRLPERVSHYQALINKMMAKDREKRFQSGDELIKFIDGMLTAQEFFPPPITRPESATVKLNESIIRKPIPPTLDLSGTSGTQRKKKKWVPISAAVALVIVLAVFLYIITQKPVTPEDKEGLPGPTGQQTRETLQEKQPTDQLTPDKKEEIGKTDTLVTTGKEEQPVDAGTDTKKETGEGKSDTAKKEITPLPEEKKPGEEKKPPEEKKPADKKNDTQKEVTPDKKAAPDLKPVEKQKKPEPIKTKKESPAQVKTVNLLEVSPAIRQEYSNNMQRIQIRVFNARFQVHGLITLSLFIDEKGKITVSSFTDQLTVKPEGRKGSVINGIKNRIGNIPLTPPKDKEGNPVRFNWRVTYKVGKYLNRIILVKQ